MKWFIFVSLLALNSNAIAYYDTKAVDVSGIHCKTAQEIVVRALAGKFYVPRATKKITKSAKDT